MNPKEKAKKLPTSPGVYLMKDSNGDILYVGKSKNLKNRVNSYFQASRNHPPKIERLVKNLKDFDFITTDTEFEAFILECQLIKKLKPIYNKQMKTPSSYVYIEINSNDKDKRINIVANPNKNSSSMFFGPYSSKNTVEKAIKGIKEFYKIDCSGLYNNSACLNYSMGLCIGMCLDETASMKYDEIINKIIRLLKGTDIEVLEKMTEKMNDASENCRYEIAAKYRDYINALKSLINKEKAIKFIDDNKNIVVVESIDNLVIKLFLIKGKRVVFKEKYNLDNFSNEELHLEIRSKIINYFKEDISKQRMEIKKEDIDEIQIVYNYLKNSNCKHTIISPEWLNPKDYSSIDRAISILIKQK